MQRFLPRAAEYSRFRCRVDHRSSCRMFDLSTLIMIMTNSFIKITTLVFLASILQGCCSECDKPSYGEFPLSEASVNRMSFANQGTRTYVSTDGDKINLQYFTSIRETEEGTYACDYDNYCDVCCATFDAEYFYVQLADDNNTRRFEFYLTKDFSRSTPLEEPDSITEALFIAYNTSQITGTIGNVAEASPDETITLDGRTFDNTRVFEAATSPPFNEPTFAVRFYFSFSQGIVGFQTLDETIWRLSN